MDALLVYLANEDVFRVEEITVPLALYHVDHTGLQVQQQRSRDVVVVIRLVEENILAVVTLTTNGIVYGGDHGARYNGDQCGHTGRWGGGTVGLFHVRLSIDSVESKARPHRLIPSTASTDGFNRLAFSARVALLGRLKLPYAYFGLVSIYILHAYHSASHFPK